MRLGGTLVPVLDASQQRERRALAAECEALIERDTPPLLRWLVWSTVASAMDADTSRRSRQAVEAALEAARESKDRRALLRSLCSHARLHALLGDADSCEAALREAWTLLDPDWEHHNLELAFLLDLEAFLQQLRGDDRAISNLRRAVALRQEAGFDTLSWRSNVVDTLLAIGDIDGAIEEARTLLRRHKGSRKTLDLMVVRLNLCAALCVRGETAEPRALAERSWSEALRFGLAHDWVCYLAAMAGLEGRPRAAARLAGWADAAFLRLEEPPQRNESAALERGRGLARAALGEALAASLEGEGAALGADELAAIAFASADEAASIARL